MTRPSGVGNHGKARAAIGGVRRASDKAIRFQPIDELRDVRLDTREPVRELPERQLASGSDESIERRQLRQREPRRSETRVDVVFGRACCAEQREKGGGRVSGRGAHWRSVFTYSTTDHTSSFDISDLNAGIFGLDRPFQIL